MRKILQNIKTAFRGIIWPKPKLVCNDTIFAITTTIILSSIIWVWVTGVDIVINLILSIF